MPIYDYRCDHCGHAFSKVQSYSEEPVQKCPNCGKIPRRLVAPAAFVFKRSGLYKTDSRPAENTETKAESKSETKSDTKSETKSDTKAKPKGQSSPKSEASS